MSKEVQVILTASGKERLNEALSNYQGQILDGLRAEKFIPGDEKIEITAKDIDEMVSKISDTKAKPERAKVIKTLSLLYIILGVGVAVAGAFWDRIGAFYVANPKGALMVSVGLAVVAFGIAMRYLIHVFPPVKN